MTITTDPGIYMVRNKFNGATYVGAAKKGRRRVLGQLNSLMRGDNTSELLQTDWERFGPEAFEVSFLPVSLEKLYWLERVVIKAMNGLEERGGYNKALGKIRTLAARIRDTEAKLMRNGKYVMLPWVSKYERINPLLADSFCQKTYRLSDETTALEGEISFAEAEIDELLEGFEVFDAVALTSKRRTLH